MVRNVKVHVQLPVLGVEPDHLGCERSLEFSRPGVPYAPHQAATPRWRDNVEQKDDGQVGALVPLEHGKQQLFWYEVICFIDTACITPCPLQPSILHDLAEHLQFVMGGRFLEFIHHCAYDLLEQRFIVLPHVGEHPVTIVLCNLMLDVDVVNAGRRGGDQFVEGSV